MAGKLIAVMGTNASGKSGLGIELAAQYGGEVVSADSRQVFRGLDLGSGKVTPEETRGVPHHLIDVCGPGDFFSMADFQRLAYAAIDDILSRGKLPFLVGGSGLYVDAVTDGYELSEKEPDLELRAYLETFETPALYAMLKEKLPGTDIDLKNRNRVMRALERLEAGDYHPGKHTPRYQVLKLGVTWPREILKQRIDERLDKRLKQGMIDEVKGLMDAGVSTEFLRKLGLEYRYLTEYLQGQWTYEQMLDELSRAIKRFAKRQMTWFRREEDLHWLDMANDPVAQAKALIDAFISEDLPQ
ncbi:MAG: tRNA (adenosine(37)-N6)-dimethylallyltransferase MiaA [Clostridia bacterium]|nr:tRNA (adenosine(37)-N6)-dimethylallyltransferase MiaA [Clostridia bacterium]